MITGAVPEYYCRDHPYNIKLKEVPPSTTMSWHTYFDCPECGKMYRRIYPESASGIEQLVLVNDPEWWKKSAAD